MKQIEFTLEAFGPDGMLKEGYEVKPKNFGSLSFFKVFKLGYGDFVSAVFNDGSCKRYTISEFDVNFILYRRTRTAEEVARETSIKIKESPEWDRLGDAQQILRRLYVQAGMDEMKND